MTLGKLRERVTFQSDIDVDVWKDGNCEESAEFRQVEDFGCCFVDGWLDGLEVLYVYADKSGVIHIDVESEDDFND